MRERFGRLAAAALGAALGAGLAAATAAAAGLPTGTILVVASTGEVFEVDRVSGDRTILSSDVVGSGPVFGLPNDIAEEPGGDFVVADIGAGAIVRVDPATGDRTVVSSGSVGSGPLFVAPASLVVEPGGDIVVLDSGIPGLVRVDPASGDRTDFSSATAGTGTSFSSPTHVDREPDGSFLVPDATLDGVFRVDASGNRTLFASPSAGGGPNFSIPVAAVSGLDLMLPVVDFDLDTLFDVDPLTGDRSVLSSSLVGTGRDFDTPEDVAIEPFGTLLVSNSAATRFVLRVDPATGDRSVLSESSGIALVGAGPVFGGELRAIHVVQPVVVAEFDTAASGSAPSGAAMLSGNVTVESVYGFTGAPIVAPRGRQVAYLTTGLGSTGAGSSGTDRTGNGADEIDVASLSLVFTRAADDPPNLAFEYDVLTGESGFAPDAFEITLDGAPLANGAIAVPNGSFPAVTGFSGPAITGPDASFYAQGRLGFQTVVAPVGTGMHALEFFVGDETDAFVDTALLIDRVRLVPEPARWLQLAAGAALLVLARRRRP